jgi:hypothetical protein
MNVIVTGSRDWPEEQAELVIAVLDGIYWNATLGHLVTELSEFHLYVGDCPTGVDAIVKWWAEQSPSHSYNEREDDPYFELHRFEADWDRWGKAAGPIRNAEMLDNAREGLVFAFHKNRDVFLNLHREDDKESGTNHCANLARRMGGFKVYDLIGDFK